MSSAQRALCSADENPLSPGKALERKKSSIASPGLNGFAKQALGSELAAASSPQRDRFANPVSPGKAAEQKKKLHRLTRAYRIYGARSRELAAESSLRNPLSPGKAMELFFLSPEPYQGLMDFRPRCRARRNFIIFLMKIFFPDTKTYGSEQNIIKINEFR